MSTVAIEITVNEAMLREVNPVIPADVRKFFPPEGTDFKLDVSEDYTIEANMGNGSAQNHIHSHGDKRFRIQEWWRNHEFQVGDILRFEKIDQKHYRVVAQGLIHIQWDGPFGLTELSNLSDESKDYGIYQIYGSHPVYGKDVLLYIGKASEQTFATRIAQEGWSVWECDEGQIGVRVGRLAGDDTPPNNQWSQRIDLAEAILITAHKPARNATMVGSLTQKRHMALTNLHVLNWGEYGALLPEVSGDRWTDKWISDKYDVYGSHRAEDKTTKLSDV
jgi:hypothetical protein